MLLLAVVLLLATACRAAPNGTVARRQGAATSDYGRFEVYASGKDAWLYFTDDAAAVTKIHIILGIPSCYCINTADLHKDNQFNYLGTRGFCSSFGIYVNDGLFQNRERCNLNTAELQARTELEFNPLGSPAVPAMARRNGSWVNHTDEWLGLLAPKPKIWERIEGAALAMGMRDFYEHSYVTSHRGMFFTNDSPGGFFYMQGTVMVRPCRLQWFVPFIFSPHGVNHLMPYTLPYDARKTGNPEYYGEDDAVLLNTIFNRMRDAGIITEAHLHNLGLNNLATYNVRAFEFTAAYIPYRRAEEFLRLVEPFAYTGLWPWVYVPLVYQMMFPPGEWMHMRADDNETIAQGEALMLSCRAETVDAAAENVNHDAAETLFYYSYTYCGGAYIDPKYVVARAVLMISFYWQRVVVGVLTAFIVCMLLLVLRSRLAKIRRGRRKRHTQWSMVYEYMARCCPWVLRDKRYKALARDEDGDGSDDGDVPLTGGAQLPAVESASPLENGETPPPPPPPPGEGAIDV